MKILIDIGHPAHVHLFRNFIKEMEKRGHIIFVTIKDIPAAKILLDLFHINYIEIGQRADGLIGKAITLVKHDWNLLKLVNFEQIDVGFGSSISLAHVARFSKMISFLCDDDDSSVEPLVAMFGHPFADYLVSPDVLKYERTKKNHITYAGYHELAYLHPNRFIPDSSVLNDAGVKKGEPFFIMRFNAFKAHHDIGAQGLSIENKQRLIEFLCKKGKVFITTERDIEPEFEAYQLKISPEKAHSLIYYSTMLIGDSQTMTSEAAVLGTPAIRSNSFVGKISYLEEEEYKYGLTYGFLPDQTESMFKKIKELLDLPDLKAKWQEKREHMLKEKIDVTSFFVWLIDTFPESIKILKSNPEIQYTFL